LAQRLPKILRAPHFLTLHLQQEISARLRAGEPAVRIADAHKLDVETVKRLAR